MNLNYLKNKIVLRIIYVLVSFFLYGFLNNVFAFTYPANLDTWRTNFNLATDALSPSASCQLFASIAGWAYVSTTNIGANSATCNYDDNGISRSNQTAPFPTCPNGTLQGSIGNFSCFVANCTPPEVNDLLDGSCNPPPSPCNDLNGIRVFYSSTSHDFIQCFNGCEVARDNAICQPNLDGVEVCRNDGNYNGNSCTGTITEPSPSPEFDCISQGLTYGTVNGSIVCVPNGTSGSPITESYDSSDKTITNDDGSTIEQTTDTQLNSDGTVTSTTTTTTTPSNGDPATTETQTEEQDFGSFCEENPNAKICEQSDDSVFSGSCASNFHCEGDAIQCAIAQEQHIRNCELFETETTQSQLVNNSLNNGDLGDSDHPYRPENRTDIDVPTTLDTSKRFSGSVQDLSVDVGGYSVTLPFSFLNQPLSWLGNIAIALTLLAAYFIVGIRR